MLKAAEGFVKLPALESFVCCLNCGPKPATLSMEADPHPGFGGLVLTCDGEVPEAWWDYSDQHLQRNGLWSESRLDTITMAEIEEAAAAYPEHDWRLRIDTPMYDATYQRQGEGEWVLVERGQGFA